MSIYQFALILILMFIAFVLILRFLLRGNRPKQHAVDQFVQEQDRTTDRIEQIQTTSLTDSNSAKRLQEDEKLPAPPLEQLPRKIFDRATSNMKMRSQLYHYAAYVRDVYDGDTIRVDIDLGMGIWRRDQSIRLWKINAPEVRGTERAEGLITRDWLRKLILDQQILLRTILDKRGQDRTGKFGRLLGEILLESEDGRLINVNEQLLDQGLAVPISESGAPLPMPAAMPQPSEKQEATAHPPTPPTIACPYCGEGRRFDHLTQHVSSCPNCFDEEYKQIH